MTDVLLREAMDMAPALEEIFFALHRDPELGDREEKTAALIRRRLTELGIPWRVSVGTGTLALIQGGRPGSVIGFRADMDALPIQEKTELPYASRKPGVMHACGHDFHVAALLGTAELLARHQAELPGGVKLFFQPNEEGAGGASRMIADGGMVDPPVEAMFAVHVDASGPAGTALVREGTMCAASDPFTIRLRGKGTHGAKPHLGSDVIVATAQLITALQTIASRRTSPTEPVVVTVGAFHAGTAGNVLPEAAELQGTLRTTTADARRRVREELTAIAHGIAAAMGVEAEVCIEESCPCCENHPEMTRLLRQAAGKILGENGVLEIPDPSLGGDDFAFFSSLVPGCYWNIGVAAPTEDTAFPIHSPNFVADPAALPLAAAIQARLALDFPALGEGM